MMPRLHDVGHGVAVQPAAADGGARRRGAQDPRRGGSCPASTAVMSKLETTPRA